MSEQNAGVEQNVEKRVFEIKKKSKVAIVGCADSKNLAPFDKAIDWEFWGVNNLHLTLPGNAVNFRQWASKTPGHPEYGLTPGVETTTGPLGQGLMNSVGMAMAEAHLAAVYNRENFNIFDHFTYAFCSDGDLMEGASHEAASLAGHFALGKLIWIYDDNHITIEGKTDLTYSDDVTGRFEAYHWQVQNIGDAANDLEVISRALEMARNEKERTSLIIVRSHIGYGSPNMQDTPEVHGAPLGEEEIRFDVFYNLSRQKATEIFHHRYRPKSCTCARVRIRCICRTCNIMLLQLLAIREL